MYVWSNIHQKSVTSFMDAPKSGWAVVDEYEDDDLADDSEDEKRMEKAKRLAEKKLAKKRKLREVKVKEVLSTSLAAAGGAPFFSKAPFVEPAKAAMLKPPPRFPMGTCFQCGTSVTGGRNVQKRERLRILFRRVSTWCKGLMKGRW